MFFFIILYTFRAFHAFLTGNNIIYYCWSFFSLLSCPFPFAFIFICIYSFKLFFSIIPFDTVSLLPEMWFPIFTLKSPTIITCWYFCFTQSFFFYFQSVQLLFCVIVLVHYLVSCSLEVHKWIRSWSSVFGCLIKSIVSELLHHIYLLLLIWF